MLKQIKIKQLGIEYYEQGTGLELVFLHGAMVSFRFYKRSLDYLSNFYKVYAPVLPGMGRSQSAKKDNSFKLYCEIIETFIKRRTKDPLLVGHSMGGAVLAKIVSENPGITKHLILIDSAGIPYKNFTNQMITGGWNQAKIHLRIKRTTKKFPSTLEDLWIMLDKGPIEALRIGEILKNIDIRKNLKKISIPTQIVWGSEDKHFPKNYAKRFHSLIQESTCTVVPNMDHNWIGYYPRSFLKIIRSLLKKYNV